MTIKDIKNPNDILTFMKENIKYGWLDINNECHIGNMKNFRKLYRTSTLKEVIKYGIGTCIEQVKLMSELLTNIGISNKMFCTRIYEGKDFNNLETEEHMHCFVLYYLNNKVYHIEHPNWEKVGIYKYETEEEAIKKINDYYIEMSGGIARPVTEFYDVKPGLTFKEFNEYINGLDKNIFYHVVTEKRVNLNQIIKFDNNHHSGVYNRVYNLRDKVDDIINNPNKYKNSHFDHHLEVAIRELAMEKIRKEAYPNYPSRLASLYVSKSYDEAKNWYDYFISLGRPTYQIVKVITDGNSFTGDACNCFDGTIDKKYNENKARYYWSGKDNNDNKKPVYETIIDGNIQVIEILLENKTLT